MHIFATDLDDSQIKASMMIAAQRGKKGVGLPSYFYKSPVIFEREMNNIILKGWIYAGHTSQLPNPGDFITLDIGEDSVLIVRDHATKEINAIINSCRHRGARVCEEKTGHRKTFVCPYHGWTYNTDGTLRYARDMEALEGFNCDHYPLHKIHVHIFHGLIFVNFDESPNDFKPALDLIEPMVKPYQLDNAKIAESRTYKINANWKFAVENYLECYHCASSHRQFAKGHTIREMNCHVEHLEEAMRARTLEATGQGPEFCKEFWHIFDDATAFGCDVGHDRYALYDGYLTGSEDGQPVAPLLGDMKGYDGGVGDFQIGPLCFMLIYPDHGVLYNFIPRGLHDTDLHMQWFVRADAVEGEDYAKEDVVWLWHHTTLEDEFIITRNAEGALSRFYEPGPLHPEFEDMQGHFLQWLLAAIDNKPLTQSQTAPDTLLIK